MKPTAGLIPLDTPEAIAACKARQLAARVFPYVSAKAIAAAAPWPGKRARKPATLPAPAPTSQPTTPAPIAPPAPASPAPIDSFDLSDLFANPGA